MKRLSFTICTLIVGAVTAFASDDDGSTKTMRNLVVEGNRLFKEENYHAALEKYEQALALEPSYQYAMYDKAVALVQLATDDNKNADNDPRKAAAALFADVAKANTNPELASRSYYNLGNLAFNDEQYDQAISMYKGSLRIDPDNRQCRQNLLMALQKKQEQEQNKENQDQNKEKEDQQQQQQDQQQQQQQDQQQDQQQQPMTQSAEQILQAMQNKENATRQKANRQQPRQGQRSTEKPW